MRTDENLTRSRTTRRIPSLTLLEEVEALVERLPAGADLEPWATLSGHEPNSLFLNFGGRRFADVSGISGIDHEGDGRVLAIWDFNRDGLPDLALANANAPRLQIFENRLGRHPGGSPGRFIALRLVGGNRQARPSARWSARDGYGARVTLRAGRQRRRIEHRCGEGFAAQNSKTMLIGLGAADAVETLEIAWPSGVLQEAGQIPAGSLVTAYEDPGQAPGGDRFQVRPYFLQASDRP